MKNFNWCQDAERKQDKSIIDLQVSIYNHVSAVSSARIENIISTKAVNWECFNYISIINKEIGKLAYYRSIISEKNSEILSHEIKASLATLRKSHLALINILR